VISISSVALLGVSLILLIAERVQEIVFGGAAAVAMSIVAFVVSRKVPSKTISILLFVNGGIIIIGEIITTIQAKFSSEDIGGKERNIALGLFLIGLGIWKIICDRKLISKVTHEQQQQKEKTRHRFSYCS
jgi:uncharacterized membrane-anchored protein YitT (DUF2179 family)